MPKFYCYTSDELEIIHSNYLKPVIERAAVHYKKTKICFFHCRAVLRHMISFGNWLKLNKIPVKSVRYCHVNEFLTTSYPHLLGKLSKQKTGARKAVSLILEMFPPKMSVFQYEADRLRKHLLADHGLSEKRSLSYAKHIEKFLTFSFPNKSICICSLKPSHVRKFIESIPSTKANSTRSCACNALRAYFRFLELNGTKTVQVAAAIPVISNNRRSLPRHVVDSASLKTLLKVIDRSTKIGKRNYAVVLCLVDLAMRVGDVASLKLDDIDWRKGTIRIHAGKTGTPFAMPLSQRVGDAIVDYIKCARPVTDHRDLFMNHKLCNDDAPTSVEALKEAVKRLWISSGLSNKFSGTHILRHSTATALRQKGVSLKVIADFLGHNSIEITKRYAQVDINALCQIIQPWPAHGGAK